MILQARALLIHCLMEIFGASFHLSTANIGASLVLLKELSMDTIWGSPVAWNSLPPDRYRAKGNVVGCR